MCWLPYCTYHRGSERNQRRQDGRQRLLTVNLAVGVEWRGDRGEDLVNVFDPLSNLDSN